MTLNDEPLTRSSRVFEFVAVLVAKINQYETIQDLSELSYHRPCSTEFTY
jgi:hypothetical protein